MKDEVPSARSVSERLLQVTGDALKTGDFETFAGCFALPHVVDTFEGRRTISSKADIREIFDCTRRYFDAHNITDLVRTCVEAEFRDPDTIASTHISRILSGTRLVQEPYPVFTILKRTEAGWKISDGQYAIQKTAGHLRALTENASPLMEVQEAQSA